MRRLLVTAAAASVALAAAAAPTASALPGGVFITGHDPDFHAHLGGNHAGARNMIRRSIEFVTNNDPSPTILLVTSRITPPAGHVDSQLGLAAAGYTFDMSAALGASGTLDLATVDFNAYDVVVIASDFGGILTQSELDILNNRAQELRDYVNAGKGIVAFAESNSGARLTPSGGHFDWLPFLATEAALNQNEIGYTVTAFGASLGLTDADVNGNASHNVFTNTGGLQVVNVDAAGRTMSLAARGAQLCPGGVPSVSVDDVTISEPDSGDVGTMTFTLSLSTAPCAGAATVDVSTADGTAEAGSDYVAISPANTVTFAEGETSKQVIVSVNGDNLFEGDETLTLNLSNPSSMTVGDGQGLGTILNDDPQNQAPDCATVEAIPGALWPPNHKLVPITLDGGTDPEGGTVTVTITGVTQDEPLDGTGDGDTSPDAADMAGATVKLRAERAGDRDGRVYTISFTGTDPDGGSCTGTTAVGVPHDRSGGAAVDSGQTVDSFGS